MPDELAHSGLGESTHPTRRSSWGIHADLLLVVAGILVLAHVARPLRTASARELPAVG